MGTFDNLQKNIDTAEKYNENNAESQKFVEKSATPEDLKKISENLEANPKINNMINSWRINMSWRNVTESSSNSRLISDKEKAVILNNLAKNNTKTENSNGVTVIWPNPQIVPFENRTDSRWNIVLEWDVAANS